MKVGRFGAADSLSSSGHESKVADNSQLRLGFQRNLEQSRFARTRGADERQVARWACTQRSSQLDFRGRIALHGNADRELMAMTRLSVADRKSTRLNSSHVKNSY